MTANELADFVEISKPNDKTHQAIATMLRQQQAEIGRLKQIIDANNLNQNIGQFVKPANEPVAWLFRGHFYDTDPSDWTVHEHPNVPVIPLYTHPMRELTDEEIMQVCSQIEPFDDTTIEQAFIEFARAILKKAREHE